MSDVIAAAVLEVQGDVSDFVGKLASAQEVAKRFENATVQAAGRASGALKDMGKGAGDGLKELDPVTRRAAEGLQLMAAKATLTAGELALFRAAAKGANVEALGPMAALLDKINAKQAASAAGASNMAAKLGLVGISAGQASAAMRSLPAQFTDIATQLAGGQNPFQILLQQGGQIKDQFGGVGNAFRALGSVLTPARLLFGGVAAAVGAAALAYKQGAEETDNYRKALALTNNAAGTTIGQLQVMAQSVSAIAGGTQGKAAEVLTALASSAKVAGADLTNLTAAAIKLERAGGPAALETAKAFAALADAPTSAAITLSKSTGFLTAAVYEQARALELQGRTSAAAAVVQQAYAAAVETAAKKVEGGLGSIERALRGGADLWKRFWDAALDIGRTETVETRLKSVSDELDRRRRAVGPQLSARSQPLLDEQSVLQSDVRTNRMAASLQATANEAAKARISFDQMAESVQAPAKALENQVAQVRNLGRAAGLSEQQIEAMVGRVTSLSAVNQQAIAGAQAALQAGAAVQAAQTSAKLQDLQHQRAMGYISEIDYLQKVGAANVEAAKADEQRIQKSIALAKQLPLETRDITIKGLQGQADAAAIRTAEERAKAENKVQEILQAKSLATYALERATLQELKAEQDAADVAREDRFNAAQIAAQEYAASLDDAAYALGVEAKAALQNDLQRSITTKRLEVELDLRRKIRAIEMDAQFGRITNDQAQAQIAQERALAERAAGQATDKIVADFEANGARQISDALLTALEGGFDSAWDYLKKLAKREVIKVLFQPVANQIGNVISGAITQAQGGTPQNATYLQAASAVNSLYGYGKSAYGWLMGGSSGGGAAAGATAAQLDAAAGSGAEAGAQAGAASAAASASSWVPYVGWALAAYGISAKAYAQGFTNQNTDNKAIDSGAAGAVGLGGPIYVSRLLDSLGIGSSKWNQIFSGAAGLNYLFGRGAPQITGTGITGDIQGGDFTGNAFADVTQKGGIFRSDKNSTQLADLPSDLGKFIDDAAREVLTKAKDYGAALGLPGEQLAGITKSIKVTLTEDAAKNQTEIVNALAGYGEALVAGYADAIKPLAQYGETAVQTITRVGGALKDTNEVLTTLGLTALQASIAGGQAAVSLEDLFGGLDGLQQSASSYLANFYTDTERTSLSLSAIGKVLAEVGVAVPSTRDAFRGLVDAQDLTTEAGRKTFAVLMGVASAFAEVVPAARSAADILSERTGLETRLLTLQGDTATLRERELAALDPSNRAIQLQIWAIEDQTAANDKLTASAKEAAAVAAQVAATWKQSNTTALDGVKSAYAAVAQAISSEQQSVKSTADQQIQSAKSTADQQIQTLEQQAQKLQSEFNSLFDSLKGNIQGLLGDIAGDGGRAAAIATLQAARSGGAIDPEALRQAGGIAAKVSTDPFATRLDFAREQGRTVALLRDVSASARRQLTSQTSAIAAQQVAIERARDAQVGAIEKARDSQLAALGAQLAEARSAAASLVSIDDGVQTVAGAIATLANAVSAAKLLQGQGGPTGQILTSGGQQVYGSTAGAVVTRPVGGDWSKTVVRGTSGAMATGDVLRTAIAALVANDNWARIVEVAKAEGIDSNTIDGLMDWTAGTTLAAAKLRGLPAFAVGSPYVPATGPAIVHEGERIFTVPDNAELMRMVRGRGASGELVVELKALRDEVAQLRAENRMAQVAIARNTRRSAEVHEDWNVNGLPATTTL